MVSTSVFWYLWPFWNKFILQVVEGKKSSTLLVWSNWIKEDFLPIRIRDSGLSLYLFVNWRNYPIGLVFWLSPVRLLMLTLIKYEPLTSEERMGQRCQPNLFWILWVTRTDFLDIPTNTGEELYEVVMAKHLLQVVYMVWRGTRLKRSPFPGLLALHWYYARLEHKAVRLMICWILISLWCTIQKSIVFLLVNGLFA